MSARAAPMTRACFGAAFIVIAETAVLAGWTPLSIWTTPICWWGYILLLDALLQVRTGRSPFVGRPGRFVAWCGLSILFWLLFEAYNLRLRNWEYIGLPEERGARLLGYALSFATIQPGLFLTARSLGAFGLLEGARCRPWRFGPRAFRVSIVLGAAALIVPVLVPATIGHYLFAFVWIGFVLLLEPINERIGAASLLRDLRRGDASRALRLLMAGYLCGILWEFWNYWAGAKWIYHVPFLPQVKFFEMPLPGFLGFGPFALEFFALYSTCEALWRRLRGRGTEPPDFSP